MIDIKAIHWSLSQEADYATCVKNVLFIIRTNHAHLKKMETNGLLQEFIFMKIQKDESSAWNQVGTSPSKQRSYSNHADY